MVSGIVLKMMKAYPRDLYLAVGTVAVVGVALIPIASAGQDTDRGAWHLSRVVNGYLLYAADNSDTTVPAFFVAEDSAQHGKIWAQRLLPYVFKVGYFNDPFGPSTVPAYVNTPVPYAARPNTALNWHVGLGLATSSLRDPANLMVHMPTGVNNWFGDRSFVGAAATLNPWHQADVVGFPEWATLRCQQFVDGMTSPYVTTKGQSAWAPVWRHTGGSFASFADGHVAWIPRAGLLAENLYPGPVPAYAQQKENVREVCGVPFERVRR